MLILSNYSRSEVYLITFALRADTMAITPLARLLIHATRG
jgi:hypothetical protein